jgi:hypothetical protein
LRSELFEEVTMHRSTKRARQSLRGPFNGSGAIAFGLAAWACVSGCGDVGDDDPAIAAGVGSITVACSSG